MSLKQNLLRGRVLVVAVVAAAALTGCTKTLNTDSLEGQIKSGIESQTSASVSSVDCPSGVKIQTGGTFECTVKLSDGTTRKVKVTQKDDKGNVHWELEA